MSATTPTLYIVDPDECHRRSLERAIASEKYEFCAYASGEEFLAEFQPRRPACLVLDLRLPRMNGSHLLAELRQRRVRLPVIVVTASADMQSAVSAMKLGAIDVCRKPVDPGVLLAVVRQAIAADEKALEQERAIDDARRRLNTLSARERELFELLADGLSYKEIGQRLGISARTVEHHRARIGKKLSLDRLTDFVRLALRAADAPHWRSPSIDVRVGPVRETAVCLPV